MNIHKIALIALLTTTLFTISACGGGGGGGVQQTNTDLVISGVASKGPLKGAIATAYRVDSGARGAKLAESPPTDTNGNYNITIPGGYAGMVVVEVSGGTYTDEATSTPNTVLTTPLRAAFNVPAGSTTASSAVTPLTEIAVQKMGTNTITPTNSSSINNLVSNLFSVPDIIATSPVDVSDPGLNATTAQKKYALVLAAVSQLLNNSKTSAPSTTLQQVLSNLSSNPTLVQTPLNEFMINPNNGTGINTVQPPSINVQPSSPAAIINGGNTAITVAANGSGLTYQWQVDPNSGTFSNVTDTGVYSGSTTETLILSGVTLGMNGYKYQVVVSGLIAQTATSNSVTLTVVPPPPSITTQPLNSSIAGGNNTSFSISASGTGLTYQWQADTGSGIFSDVSDTVIYSGSTTATLTLTGATIGMNGYKYRVVVNGVTAPPAISNSATLTVAQATKVIVKLTTSGTLPIGTSIGAIDTTVNYQTNKGLSIAADDVVASGVASGAFVAPNTTTQGQVRLGNITLTGAGFPIGEFATLTFSIVTGNSPVPSDFTVAPGATILDSDVNPLNGISVIIQSVTIQ